MPTTGMLGDYRVLDLTDDRGQLAGFLLAQLGADVIAVEPPGGQRARRLGPFAPGHEGGPDGALGHPAHNRAKRSVVLDDAARIADLVIAGALE
jgi:crotonobetainyl-CoA:carnitine CoA-transferase CaiB-like acyl-CoA transferase